MSTQQARTKTHPGLYRPDSWPSEREPTGWDVHDENEIPSHAFMDRFRVALLHSEGAEDDTLLDPELMPDTSETVETVSSRILCPKQDLLSKYILSSSRSDRTRTLW